MIFKSSTQYHDIFHYNDFSKLTTTLPEAEPKLRREDNIKMGLK
jgi:hypothetical protein